MKLKNILIISFIAFACGIRAFATEADTTDSMFKPYTLKKGEILLNQSKRQVDLVNPTITTNKSGGIFPGARGANQLVLYTKDYGERTNTNEFGTEAIIEGNVVTELSGADSFIPENGGVISGHGVAKKWITENITVGTRIYYDEATKVITTFTTSESLLFEARKKIDEARNMVNYYKNTNPSYDWDEPNDYIKDAENYLKKAAKKPEEVQKYSHLAINAANSALKSVIPYKNNEFKGVWLRPTETTEEAIIQAIQKLKKAGIDNIILETYFHGRTIFPSKTMEKYGFIAQNEKFNGLDPLKIWIKEAHKNNIKIHIWFETFYVGNQTPNSNPRNILAVKPEWGNKTRQFYESGNATPSQSEHNGYFLDPANPEVQKFLQELITEIITTYKPDGINLDYIRYPQSVSTAAISSWGFTEYARTDFYKKYGIDPVKLSASDPLWEYWNIYRRTQVTNFVEKIGKLGKSTNTYITAAIFPDIKKARAYKQQDWQTWSANNYVNGFTPLFLTCNAKTLNSMILSILAHKAPATELYAGLFVTFMGGSEEDLIREIHEIRKLDIGGVILFDYAHLDNRYVHTLGTRVFNPKNASKQPTISLPENTAEPALVVPKKKNQWWIFK